MGQVTQFFQPSLYWQQFEDLTQSVVEVVYDVATADKIGRPGQAQDSVDVYAARKAARRLSGETGRIAQNTVKDAGL